MRKIALLLAFAVVPLGLLAPSASAVPPEITVLPIEEVPGFEPFEDTFTCPGLTLTLSFDGTIRIIRQFDRSGTTVREISVFPMVTLTYTAENGKSLTSRAPAPSIATLNADGTVAQTKVVGLLGVFHVPGGRPLVIYAGYLLFEGVFPIAPIAVLHGRHEFFGPEADVSALCQYQRLATPTYGWRPSSPASGRRPEAKPRRRAESFAGWSATPAQAKRRRSSTIARFLRFIRGRLEQRSD
jgi:hypothetical protein